MSEPLIELRGVSKSFGNNVILDEIDLEIYPDESLAIIGPSGTGKSTILRIVSGLLGIDAGEVYVQGQRRDGLAEDGQANPINISMVFQQAALFDSLTVDENVGFHLYQHSKKLSRKRIRQLVEERLEMVGLSPSIADLFPADLSGGMRKRVSFARAVMADPDEPASAPDMILYDEPTAGLDPVASTVIEDLIRQLQRVNSDSGTYAIVTHQESTIRRTADRIVFLYRGKVQWQGTVEDLDTTDSAIVRQFASGSLQGPIQVTGGQVTAKHSSNQSALASKL